MISYEVSMSIIILTVVICSYSYNLIDIINKIIPHFELYPCLTSKNLNFNDWKEIAFIMQIKNHLKKEGILKQYTDLSPPGYYFIPIYDRGNYVLQIQGPEGWIFGTPFLFSLSLSLCLLFFRLFFFPL